MADYTQTITVMPAPTISYDNPAENIEISCGDPIDMASLNYSNNGVGDCNFSGMVIPTQQGTPNYAEIL
ncbi:MAG: hypothetical protein R2766_04250 [Saprospiraceae bacterium]